MMDVADFDVLIIDKALGLRAICEFSAKAPQDARKAPTAVVWGTTMSEADTAHFLRVGVRGILSRSAETSALLTCLRSVVVGRLWVEDQVLHDMHRANYPARALTRRETHVLELVRLGYMNKEIAQALNICPSTVKIHMKNIFAKTGVRGRHSLALTSILPDGFNPSQSRAAADNRAGEADVVGFVAGGEFPSAAM